MNNEELIKKMIDEVWNKHTLNNLEKFFDANIAISGPNGDVHGIKELQNFLNQLFKAFPDISFKAEDIIISNQKVVVRWVGNGTHKGDFIGNRPTNKKMTYQGITIYKFENNKIKECWVSADLHGLLKQLGVLHAVT